jgi:tetratricopeptide (TPR) repeat protein
MMTASQRRFLGAFAIVLAVAVASPVIAQTAAQMAALEARLMARLEQRLAEESEASRADQEAQRIAFEQAIRATAQSSSPLDRRALAAIDAGRTAEGVGVLEERARARDALVTADADAAARRVRADEWKRIGALAFLDNTARSTEAYETALSFAPDDPEILDQLANLYQRLARGPDAVRVAQRLAGQSDAEWRARGLIHLGDMELEANQEEPARTHLEAAIAAAQQADSVRQEVRATTRLAGVYLLERNNRQFEATLERSLSLARANQLRYEEAEALYLLGTAHFSRGRGSLTGRRRQFEQAEAYFAQAHAIAVEGNDEISAAQVQVRRGHVARLMENNALAENYLREAIATFERRGVRARLGFAQHQLAAVLADEGRLEEARPIFRSAVDQVRAANLPLYEGSALMDWAQAEYEAGARGEACRLIRESRAAFGRAEGAGAFRMQTAIMSSTFCD